MEIIRKFGYASAALYGLAAILFFYGLFTDTGLLFVLDLVGIGIVSALVHQRYYKISAKGSGDQKAP